jgi:predicted metal-binding membrane protein
MQHRLVAPAPALGLIGVAWGLLAYASLTGIGAWFGHGHLIEGGLPIQVVLGGFLVGWLVMLLAMMLPTIPRAGLRSLGFISGFLWIWIAFGMVALAFDAGIHWIVHHSPWLRMHLWVIQAGLLATAGFYQLSWLKRRFLYPCLKSAPRDGIVEGWRAGWLSVGCCWALMLTGFAAGMAQLGWMVGLTAAMVAERDRQHSALAATGAGLFLLLLAGALSVASLAHAIPALGSH